MSIILEHLTVSYGRGAKRFDAARNVSLAIAEGEAFGLVGESGSGKSTVLRAVAGLIPHAEGRVVLAGQPMGNRRTTAQRKMAQMVFQDPYGSLHPSQTVDQILAMPLAIHRLDNPERRIAAALDEVGLGPQHRFRYPHQLSGGQRQRIAIARALILEPRILLLDEPTSALDVSVQAEILNLLSRLRREHGLTMLMVSHDLAVIAHLCERIAVMNRGEVVENTTADALASGAVKNPYTQQLLRSNQGFDPSGTDLDLLDSQAIRS
jgi:peptide/nickel transport system ATP-binding protein